MANIKNLDVETYVKLLISEKLGHQRDDIEMPDTGPQVKNQHKKLIRKPQIREE